MAISLIPKRKLKTGTYLDKDTTENIIAHIELDTEITYTGGIDDNPVDGKTTSPISSNWAYDHAALTIVHGATGAVVGTTNSQVLTNKTLTAPVINGIVTTTGLTFPAITLAGAITGGDQAFTNVGDMTFAAGSILASGSTNGNTFLIRANDTTFITLTTGTTDVCTLNAITMSGTWLASGTVTLPAVTLGGAITGGAQNVRGLGYTDFDPLTDLPANYTNAQGIVNLQTGLPVSGDLYPAIIWGDSTYGYANMEFRPERRTGINQADVALVAHWKNANDASVHRHFSLYSSNAAGTPTKRVDLNYLTDTPDFTLVEIDALHFPSRQARLSTDKPSMVFHLDRDNDETGEYLRVYKNGTDLIFQLDSSGNIVTLGTIAAHSLAGKLTGGANEIEGSNFDIDGGTIDGVTITSPTINGTIATTGLTLPAVTLGGNVAGGGKVISSLDRRLYNETNLLENGSFEVGNLPTGWTLGGAGASHERSTEQIKIGSYSAKLTNSLNNYAAIYQQFTDTYYRSKKVTMGAWVYASVASRVAVAIWTGAADVFGSYHSSTPGWEWLTVTATVTADASFFRGQCRIYAGAVTSAYFDGAIMVEGDSCPAFSPKPASTYGATLVFPIIQTTNASMVATTRASFTGGLAIDVITWAAITHTDLNLSDYLGLFKTDTDSAVEAELWYDDSENVLKYYNGTSVKTLATTA